MTCDKCRAFLPDMLLDPTHAPAHISIDMRQHLAECTGCQTEWKELQATMELLDEWKAPEPSAYFGTRMAARLRQEKEAPAPGWLERLRTRVLFDSNLHLRPAIAAALALLLIAGAGSYEGFVSLNHTPRPAPTVSATVNDLELLDRNAKTLQQLAAFDDSDAAVRYKTGGSSD